MLNNINTGAKVVVNDWLHLCENEKLLIITNHNYLKEAKAIETFSLEVGASVEIMEVENLGGKVGVYFDKHINALNSYDAIIGATEYSIVTTRAAKRAIDNGSKFLSLPLSTSNGKPMLGFEFMTVDIKRSKDLADKVMPYFNNAKEIKVVTDAGTDLTISMEGRNIGLFNGDVTHSGGYSSSSIELYIPIVETSAEGVMVVDGSLGYIGKVDEPTSVYINGGKITEIEQTSTGVRLERYIEGYKDDRVRFAGEFGLGLNDKSNCAGNCYIEDESALGTFHIGFGRNLALGGIHEASGHYDLVCYKPTIHVDGTLVMKEGTFLV